MWFFCFMISKKKVLLFGINSSIGEKLALLLKDNNYCVFGVGRNLKKDNVICDHYLCYDPFVDSKKEIFFTNTKFDAVVFSQGINCNDSIYNFSMEENLELYRNNYDARGRLVRITIIA